MLSAIVSACGRDDTTTARSGPSQRPTGAQDVVVQVMVSGGFVPAPFALTATPSATVLGDGHVITSAPVPAIYPGPAIAPLQSTKVDAATVDGLIDRARTLGLLDGELDFGRPPVADAPDTEVTIVANGRTHRHVAYALGIGEERSGGGAGGGLTARQVANRKALSEFVEATQALPPGSEAWTPAAIAVYDLGVYQADPQLPQRPATWPLATPPKTSRDGTSNRPCTLVEGADVANLLRALTSANALTPWVVGGTQHALAFRPVVPGQPGCQ